MRNTFFMCEKFFYFIETAASAPMSDDASRLSCGDLRPRLICSSRFANCSLRSNVLSGTFQTRPGQARF